MTNFHKNYVTLRLTKEEKEGLLWMSGQAASGGGFAGGLDTLQQMHTAIPDICCSWPNKNEASGTKPCWRSASRSWIELHTGTS